MTKALKIIAIMMWPMAVSLVFIIGFFVGWHLRPYHQPTPYDVLGFYPVDANSDPFLVRVVQAELTRNLISCKIDGVCGKQTALGICEWTVNSLCLTISLGLGVDFFIVNPFRPPVESLG